MRAYLATEDAPPDWMYALALPALIGGLATSWLFVMLYLIFGLPYGVTDRLKACCLIIAPMLLTAAAIAGSRGLWRRRRATAIVMLGVADVVVPSGPLWWDKIL